MEPTSQYHPYRRIVLIFVGFVIGIVAISAVIMILQRIFYHNPYGNEIRIDNFADYYEAVPTDPREHIFNLLYNIVADNTPDTARTPATGESDGGGGRAGGGRAKQTILISLTILTWLTVLQPNTLSILTPPAPTA